MNKHNDKQGKMAQVSRNYVKAAALSKNNAGAHKHKNDRRSKDARKHWSREQW